MVMRKKLILSILLLFSVPSVQADYFYGNDLIKLMDSSRPNDIAMYRGYVAGVQDSFNGNVFCVPEKVRLSQASEIVSQFIKSDPKQWHEPSDYLVLIALKDAFPCEK